MDVYLVCGRPPFPLVEILSPPDGALFASPATFVFSAELLASRGDAGPVEFFVGTNSVGIVNENGDFTAMTPPISVTVSNLLEGEYDLTVRYLGTDGGSCTCNRVRNTVRVVKVGVQRPCVTPAGRFQFQVVTSFPGKPTIIETSPNLCDWTAISTNQPSNNTFTFTDTSPANHFRRFYRVLLPPE